MKRQKAPLPTQAKRAYANFAKKDRVHASQTMNKRYGDIGRLADKIEKRYGLENIKNLKPQHIKEVLQDLKSEGKSASTLTSYATAARLISTAVGKPNIVPRTNAELGISRTGERLKPTKQADPEKIEDIRDKLTQKGEWLGLAHDLRQAFGLRAKESLISVNVTTRPNGKQLLQIKGSKGGRPREIEIKTNEQKEIVLRVQQFICDNDQKSLIPTNLTLQQAYSQQKNHLTAVGASKTKNTNAHAARHNYAQNRIVQGTDRKQIAEELGHGRPDVLNHYCAG